MFQDKSGKQTKNKDINNKYFKKEKVNHEMDFCFLYNRYIDQCVENGKFYLPEKGCSNKVPNE